MNDLLRQRYWRLALGTGLLLLVGVVYAWSILSAPLAGAFGWDSQALSLNFTVMMSFFCLSGILGGWLCGRLKTPRWSLLLAAASSLAGFLASAFCMDGQILRLYLFYGVLVGCGAGFAYNAVIGCVTAWFPERRGLASGVLLMGFGSSTLLLGGIASSLMERNLFSWRQVYTGLGVLISLGLLLGSVLLRSPDAEADRLPKPPAAAVSRNSFTTAEMLRSRAFWLFFIFAVAGGGIGSGVIAHAGPITAEAGLAKAAALSAGILSVSNGLGRVVFGMLYDRLGQKRPMFLSVAFYAAALALLAAAMRTPLSWLAVVSYVLIGMAYGSIPTMAAAYTAARFGPAYYSTNFSVMNLTLMCSSFSSVISGSLYVSGGSYGSSFVFYALLCVCMLAMALSLNGRLLLRQ